MATFLSSYQRSAKPSIFVSYHHGGDQEYYEEFSSVFHDIYESVKDNSLERAIDSDDPDYVMRRIREKHITGTSCTFVLVGRNTPGRKYVDWETKATLDKEHALIGVQLPTARNTQEGKILVPGRLNDNISSGFAVWTSWGRIMNGPAELQALIAEAKSRPKRLIDNRRDMMARNAPEV